MVIDLNCDMGESYGRFTIGYDEKILTLVSSANIACGFHAGDPSTIHRTVKAAKMNGVSIGAHPGFPDLIGFGRREMNIDRIELIDDIIYQIGALKVFAEMEGVSVNHVKPHGALYNMANRDQSVAEAVVTAVRLVDPKMAIFGLPFSKLLLEAEKQGLRAVREFFADRTFTDDGELTPRNRNGAFIHDPKEAASRVVRMVAERKVKTVNGTDIPMEAETVCIHGDGKMALEFVTEIKTQLIHAGVMVKAVVTK